MNQSTVITIDLQDSEFLDKELYDFADFEDEDHDGVDDKRSNLVKKWGGFVWWNNAKSFSDNLSLNMRKNPYFRGLLLAVLALTIIILFSMMIIVTISTKKNLENEEEIINKEISNPEILNI